MNFIGTKNKKREGPLVAVFDIASASVGGLLFKKRKDTLPEIISSVRQPANIPSEGNFTETWRAINKSFDIVSNHLKKTHPETPDTALCVFSSPWYISQTKIINVQEAQNFKITQELIDELTKDAMSDFKTEWSNTEQTPQTKNTFIEKESIKTVLNGYATENPFGKDASDLELYSYLSLTSNHLKEKTRSEILNDIHPSKVNFNTFPYVFFNVLKGLINTKDGGVFIDMTGEITDVFLIHNNIIEEINSFSKGENFFIRQLANTLNLNFEEAKSRFSQYQRGELEKSYSEKISNAIKPAANEWGDHLKELLKEMAEDQFLPQNIYLCGRKESVSQKEIIDQLKSKGFEKLSKSGKPFDIKFLLPESLKYHFDFIRGFSGTRDIFLLISALFADKFLK